MLASIHPLGERARGNRFGVTAAVHIVGSAVGGALVGAAAGGVGTLIAAVVPRAAMVVTAAALVAGALVLEATGRAGRLPYWHRQVDEHWLDEYRGWVYGLGYGVQLGAGVVTIVSTATVYAMLVLAAAASVAGGTIVGLTFGTIRGASVLLVHRVDSPARLVAFHRSFQRLERVGRRLAVSSLGLCVAGLVVAAVAA